MSDTPRTDAILPKGSAKNPEVQHVAIELAGLARSLERENAQLRTALEHYIDMTTLAIPDDWNPAKMGGWPDINQLEKRDVGDVARAALGINDVVNERL